MEPSEKKETLTLIHWAGILPAGMLYLAMAPLPYGYYTLLRLIVCGGSVIFSVFGWHYRRPIAYLSVLMAILFNPLIPVHLDKEAWAVIDFITATYHLSAWVILYGNVKAYEEEK